MVVAMDRNHLIGSCGGLPWCIAADLRYFKRITMGKPIIMGRRTWDSIGRSLPGRTNIVVTRNPNWYASGCLVASDLDTALTLAKKHLGSARECAIIGGAVLCAQAMSRTERLYLTLIEHAFIGDAWLHSYCAEDWRILERIELAPGKDSDYALSFNTLERVVTGISPVKTP